MSLFKRKKKEEILGSIEVFGLDQTDPEKRILLDSVDIIKDEGQSDNEEVIKLNIEDQNEDLNDTVDLTDIDLADMAMMKELRDKYPDMEDMNKFIMDACSNYKELNDSEHDENEEEDDQEIARKLSDNQYNKMLADSLDKSEDEFDRAKKIEEAAQNRFDAAKKSK